MGLRFFTKPPFRRAGLRSPLYALIIGINTYASPEIHDLKGAVPDALAMKQYLEADLGVPPSQIRFLCNAEATRSAIIQEFNSLAADQRIHRGDPILIFFAGHGGEVDAPKDWEAGGAKIQMLIPHDFQANIDGRVTHGIPTHRTIGTLLSRIAKKWGNNITVIFDCCHSGSGTRAASASGRIARVTKIPNNVPSDLDLEIWSDAQRERSGFAIASGFLRHRRSSHILLAACGAKEVAYEEQGKGVFTTALLKLLSLVGVENVTYTNLLERLPHLTGQNPQCEGFHRNRTLFNAKAQSSGQVAFKVRKEGDNYVMDAGAIRGIEVGDEFTLSKDPDASRKSYPLAIFVVHEAHPCHSIMAPCFSVSRFETHKPAFALQTKAGRRRDLPVYAAEHKELGPILEALVRKTHCVRPDRPGILRVQKEKAMLTLDLDRKKVVFGMRVLDESVAAFFSSQRIPFSVELDVGKLHPVLDAAANFHWHFCRTSEDHILRNKVRLEFSKVQQTEGKGDEDVGPVIEPVGENLIQDGVIDLVSGAQRYGLKILNASSVPLYPALFYFDINNFSITLLNPLSSTSQYNVDPPLPPNGSITFGYGYGGEAPLVFTLDKGRETEFGFLKLFVGTEYVDLSDIEQSSPFMGARPIGRARLPKLVRWDTIAVTVVLRKGNEAARDKEQTNTKQAEAHGHLRRSPHSDADEHRLKDTGSLPSRQRVGFRQCAIQ